MGNCSYTDTNVFTDCVHLLVVIISQADLNTVKYNSCEGLDRSWRFQEVEAPRFQDNRHMKVVRLSALRTGQLYPPGIIPGTRFC
jgi:hypothetical protein